MMSFTSIFISCQNSNNNLVQEERIEDASLRIDTVKQFKFLGEKVEPENFNNSEIVVTSENIERLYSKYDMSLIFKKGNQKFYTIIPQKLYHNARYFTRIVKLMDDKQSNSVTFYDYELYYIKPIGDNYLIGLNSLVHSSTHYPSCYCCKILIVNEDLKVIHEKVFLHKNFPGFDYTKIDTLYQSNDGFFAELLNYPQVDADGGVQYKVYFDKNGKILRSSKKNFLK